MFVNIGQWSVQVSNVFIVPTCLTLLKVKRRSGVNIAKRNITTGLFRLPVRRFSPTLITGLTVAVLMIGQLKNKEPIELGDL
jgi:hypothetical protein